jgi:hypothetical protein
VQVQEDGGSGYFESISPNTQLVLLILAKEVFGMAL